MPITLFGSNYQAPDTFAFMSNPALQVISMQEFTAETGSTSMADYWATRDKIVAKRLVDVNKATWSSKPFRFTLERAENNIYNNRNAWNAMSEIFENGGNILAFDTETIGDFSGALADDAAQAAGITEIGFATAHHKGRTSKSFNGTRSIKDPEGSFFFGIDSKQKKWLQDVLQKKVNGEQLTDAEASAMERASRHSTLGEHGFSTFVDEWNGQQYTFVKQLNESRPDSIADIQSGIEAMASRYTANRDEQIAGLISYINKFSSKGKNRVVVGQNLAYDTGVFNRYAMMHNIRGLSDDFQYADSMFALRAWASANNTTVGEIVKQINPAVSNERLGSLEALTEAITSSTGYTKSLAHNAYEDSIATLKVFEHYHFQGINNGTHFNVVDRALEVLSGVTTTPNTATLNDSLVKINSSGNIRSQDILVIDNQPTTGYQTINQYWKFAGVGTTDYTGIEYNGKVIANSPNRYLARFESASGDGATLFKAFDDETSFVSWLNNHTSLVHPAEANIELQTAIHDRDIARRVIDGFFDPGQVSSYKKSGNLVDAGGFASFQNYYQMYKDISSLSEEAVSSMHLLDASGTEIKTASQLIANISTSDNIAGIIDYADKNGITSITSHFRTSVASQVENMTAHQAGIKSYDQRKIMQSVFSMFEDNSEFFEFADKEISTIKDNLTRTIAFQSIQKQYLESGIIAKPETLQGFTPQDFSTVSIANGTGYSRIDIENINHGSRQLFNVFNDKKLAKPQVSTRLLGAAEALNERGLISDESLKLIKATHGIGNQPFAVAESIVTQLHATVDSQINQGIDNDTLIANLHPGGSLLKSATSTMTTVTGSMSEAVKENARSTIQYLNGTVLIGGNFDSNAQHTIDNFAGIRDTLRSMHYDDESIGDFGMIYYTKHPGKSNIARFNTTIGEGQSAVRSLFYRSQKEEASAFAIFTRDQDYEKVMAKLSDLNTNATNSEVKEALNGIASFFEIPYLEVYDLGENDVIRQLTGGIKEADGTWKGGHGAQAVFVKQGDDFYRYDTLSFNMYEKDGVMVGGIKDQGGNYVTSIRQRAEIGYTAVSTGDYSVANSAFNNPNISRMTEEASPQMNGTRDFLGRQRKMHSVSVKDVDYAHTIALDPGEGNPGILGLMKNLTSSKGYDTAKGSSVQAENAIRGIFKAFGDEYNLIYDKSKWFEQANIDRVYDSEPFKHFYQRYLTDQTGGIGADTNIIQGIINGTNTHGLHQEEIKAIKALRNDSLLQILAKATNDNAYVSKDLNAALNLLAYNAQLDAVGSESYAHKMMMYVGGYHPGMMNNSGSSGLIRPTYTQRANYRSYRLDGTFFRDTDSMRSLGIKFGDAYTTKQYVDFMTKLDTKALEKAGQEFNSANVSRRNIIGAVQSMSDTEIRAGREQALEYMRLHKGDLDEGILEKVYNRMINDINTYEGKAYVRPSVANQEFFMLGDPKNIKSPQIKAIFEIGTEAEQQETNAILNQLIGKRVENGTVIGRKLNRDGSFRDVVYQGQTINELTAENVADLKAKGKTQTIVERQLEGFKIMFGEEKATAETLAYYTSINADERAQEVIKTLESFGLQDQGSFEANIGLLNRYTDTAMDAITRANETNFRTIVIGNNNVSKHLSDTVIDSKWNIIAMHLGGSEEGRDLLYQLTGGIKLADNSTLRSHLGYDAIYDTLTFDNPTDNGSINALDALVNRLRQSDNALAQQTISVIDAFEKNNIALQSIQRQQMNTFQGQAFKMDQRMYQTLVMQGEGDNGARLAELIRSSIENGDYDDTIEGLGKYGNINSTWSQIVKNRRGILKPHDEAKMVAGTMDAIDYINGKFDISTKNILSVDAQDLLSRIPKGSGAEKYANFIFKVDGDPTDYMRSLSKLGNNSTYLEFASNSFYLDLSKYGSFEFNGHKGLTGVVLPYQIIHTADEEMYLGESTQATLKFFRTLQDLSTDAGTDNSKAINDALTKLFRAYGEELSTANKDSLITKSLYKMKMPNSSGALAKDAIVPTLDMPIEDINMIRDLQYEIGHDLDIGNGIDKDKITALNEALSKRKEQLITQKNAIRNETTDVVSKLNITSGSAKYADYLRHYDTNGNLVGDIIESAITTSKDMFKATEMDTGHIGWQIAQDYFTGGSYGIKNYDSFSKITKKAFHIEDTEMLEALIRANETLNDDKINNALTNALYKTEKHARDAQGNIIVKDGQAVMEQLSTYDRVSHALTVFDKTLNEHLADANLSDADKRELLLKVNQAFENIGDRYATEVGILGLTGRYPFFNETGVLPVRIYLDDAVKGKEIRFLGPQFSILQNLDFDGDTEFLKFLGNGGLLAKNAEESLLMQHQFAQMNSKNTHIFAESLKDSIKSYAYGDEASFKAAILKDLDRARYDNVVTRFMGGLTDDARTLVESSEKDVQSLLIAHSKPMKELFAEFDVRMGKSVNNPDMIKAAIQARLAKEYIGNYSKSNLEIRNAMTYMMSVADDTQLEKLRQIRNLLYTFDQKAINQEINTAPSGLLTLLEQKGIDTKHVHDAATLNNSSAWRVGVTQLFNNANGATKVDQRKVRDSMVNLVEGARKVFFSDSEKSNLELAQEIMSTPFTKWHGTLGAALLAAQEEEEFEQLGKIYLSGLYEMSQMDHAYEAFHGVFRTKQFDQLIAGIQDMSDQELKELIKGTYTYDYPVLQYLLNHNKNTKTDELLNVFGRALREGDILAYEGENGPIGFVFNGLEKVEGKQQYRVLAEGFDFTTGQKTGKAITSDWNAITIRDLNRNIKKYGNGALLDLKDLQTPERNLNFRAIQETTSTLQGAVTKNEILGSIGALSTETNLQWFFDNADASDADFNARFNLNRSASQNIPGYDGNRLLGTTFTDITDRNATVAEFRRRVIDINERVQFGIEHGMISGSSDAKELIRSINHQIAQNPRENIDKITGANAKETVEAYLANSGVHIQNTEFLTRDINNVRLSNQISSEIENLIAQRDTQIQDIAKTFYSNVTDKNILMEDAFKEAQEAWQKEVQTSSENIFQTLSRSANAKEEMMYRFGWVDDYITRNDDFILNLNNVKMSVGRNASTIDRNLIRLQENARIGFGQFTGLRLGDITTRQAQIIEQEINEALPNLTKDSLEWIAARNTQELLGYTKHETAAFLDFNTADTLLSSYKAVYNPKAAESFADAIGKEALDQALEDAAKAAREASEGIEKKTLLKDIKGAFKNISPETSRYLKIGAGVIGGTAALGLVGHALFNNNDSDNVEVPRSIEQSLESQNVKINNKSDAHYDSSPSSAQSTHKQRKLNIAPPSLPKNRTIYHDAKSGFNFKVSAQSYNKLQAESYQRMMQGSGVNNGKVNISRDNSRITDNWLENKFAQLTE